MVAYWKLRSDFRSLAKAERKQRRQRTIEGLVRLREALRAVLPERTANQTLVLGTWNIRNFDDNRFGHGSRLDESFYYLAEVISAFDIVAVQEICDDITPFERLMSTLGPTHDFIMTDVTEGPSGNSERLAFIYNKAKISFQGVAGEIVLPFEQQISDVTKARQFARTPFACTFQAGWFKFNFATVHIYYGKDSMTSAEYERRVKEIDAVAKFIAARAKADKTYNHVLVGDFNIEDFQSRTFDALARHGFQIFRNKEASNAKQTKFYDQISFMPRPGEVTLAHGDGGRSNGVFNVFSAVFRDEDFEVHDGALRVIIGKRLEAAEADSVTAEAALAAATTEAKRKKAEKAVAKANAAIAAEKELLASKAKRRTYYLDEWRTFQMSDHLPLFVELKIDFADSYLGTLAEEFAAEEA